MGAGSAASSAVVPGGNLNMGLGNGAASGVLPISNSIGGNNHSNNGGVLVGAMTGAGIGSNSDLTIRGGGGVTGVLPGIGGSVPGSHRPDAGIRKLQFNFLKYRKY